jgi:hypothetical protein
MRETHRRDGAQRRLTKAQDMILDSYAIRRERWDSLLSSCPSLYDLPEDADSSNVNAVANDPDDQLRHLPFKKKQQGSKTRATQSKASLVGSGI